MRHTCIVRLFTTTKGKIHLVAHFRVKDLASTLFAQTSELEWLSKSLVKHRRQKRKLENDWAHAITILPDVEDFVAGKAFPRTQATLDAVVTLYQVQDYVTHVIDSSVPPPGNVLNIFLSSKS